MSNAQIFLQSLLHILIPLYHALCTPDFHLSLQLSSSPSSLCNKISTQVQASRINPHTIWKRPKRWRSSQPERRLLNQCATTRAGDNTVLRYAAVGFSLTCQLLLMRETTHLDECKIRTDHDCRKAVKRKSDKHTNRRITHRHMQDGRNEDGREDARMVTTRVGLQTAAK